MEVKRTIGQSGPRTEEKCNINGARLLNGRSSMIAATFEKVSLLACIDESFRGVQIGREGRNAERRK